MYECKLDRISAYVKGELEHVEANSKEYEVLKQVNDLLHGGKLPEETISRR